MPDNQNAGTIYYDVELETAKLLTGAQKVDDTLGRMGTSANNAGKMVDSLGKGATSTGRAMTSLGSISNNTGRAIDGIGGYATSTGGAMVSLGNNAHAAEEAMSGLSEVAKAVAVAISVEKIAEYANAWVTVSNKLVNSVRANEDLATVTQRVFDISQDTRSGLEATATLYGRLERATRSAGVSTSDLSRLVETVNKGLTVSGATTEEASSTMIQLSQALASGVLRGEEFNSLSENGSRLALALAQSLGVTIGQLRAMAAQGKLTTDVVVKGLLSQSEVIGKEFSNTAMTMSQAFTVASNNITKFVGESSSSTAAMSVFNQGIITLSENLDSVTTLIGVLAVVMGGRYAGALAASTAAKISDTLATAFQSQALASASAQMASAATQTAKKAMLDKEAALSALNVAQAEANVAEGYGLSQIAITKLNAAKAEYVAMASASAEASRLETAAQYQANAAASAAGSAIGNLAKGALGLIGGPIGAATIAASAIFYFYQKSQQAKQESIDFADKLGGVIAKMKEMNQVQLAAQIAKGQQSIIDQKDAIGDLGNSIEDLRAQEAQYQGLTKQFGTENGYGVKLADVRRQLAIATGNLDSKETTLSQTQSSVGILQAQMNGTFQQGLPLLQQTGKEVGVVAGLMNQLGHAIDIASQAKDKFNSSSLQLPVSANGQKMMDELDEENKLLSIQDKRLRAVTEARDKAAAAGETNPNVIRQVGDKAGEKYDLQQAEKAREKAASEAESAAKRQANAQETVAQKLANLKQQSELAAGSTTELSRAQAILTAQQSLGKNATSADIQLAGQYAAKKWDTANAIRAQAAAEKLVPETRENANYAKDLQELNTALAAKKITQQQYNTTSEALEQQHQANLAKIRAEQVVNPIQQAVGQVDPVQQLANENAQKLALIKQFMAQRVLTEQQGLMLINAANTQYEQQRVAAQWALFTQQSTGYQALGAAVDAFGSSAGSALSGVITGTESASEAARNLANTILSSVIQTFVDMGIQQAKSAIMGASTQQAAIAATTTAQVSGLATTTAASTAAAGTTLASWLPAALVASVGSFGAAAIVGGAALASAFALSKVLGGRKNGGPVTGGGMYQVGESGLPEIYQASNGSQYMIPGDNGRVLSNKDLQGGDGGIKVTHVINNYVSGVNVQSQSSQSNGQLLIETFLTDMDNGGPMASSIQSTFGLNRRANGDY